MVKSRLLQIAVLSFSLFSLQAVAQTVYHVNINSGDDSNNGLSWNTAFQNLQAAIDVAENGDEIWIAAGVYHPTKKIADVYGSGGNETTPTGDRHRSFMIRKNVKIYGGFPATATGVASMGSRNWISNQTILSGDFNNDDGDNFENMEENAHNVIVMFDATSEMVLDGLYITGGYANDKASVYINDDRAYYVTGRNGGGLYAYSPIGASSPTISNVSFYGNYAGLAGGAIYNHSYPSSASPKITDVFIMHNKAGLRHGGGLFNDGRTVDAEITNVYVIGNESTLSGGGLYFIATEDCSPYIANTVVSGNYAGSGNGGGIYMSTYDGDAAPNIINSTICGNRVGINDYRDGGGLVILPQWMSKAVITNTVIWGNKGNEFNNFYAAGESGSNNVIIGSFIEGHDDLGDTNLPGDADPKFLEPVSADLAPTMDGDYQLMLESPLVNKGINNRDISTDDLLGNSRIFDETIDIGAYESQGSAPSLKNDAPVDNEGFYSEKTIWSSGENLYVCFGERASMRVYSIDGTLVLNVKESGQGIYKYTLPQGIYIVTLGNGITEKVIIR